jgi:hypothetical protein
VDAVSLAEGAVVIRGFVVHALLPTLGACLLVNLLGLAGWDVVGCGVIGVLLGLVIGHHAAGVGNHPPRVLLLVATWFWLVVEGAASRVNVYASTRHAEALAAKRRASGMCGCCGGLMVDGACSKARECRDCDGWVWCSPCLTTHRARTGCHRDSGGAPERLCGSDCQRELGTLRTGQAERFSSTKEGE